MAQEGFNWNNANTVTIYWVPFISQAFKYIHFLIYSSLKIISIFHRSNLGLKDTT